MGVLDARYKAEKVGYPVIGEETKEASDVIDYNINKEVTKDTSAVFNANNDTTTGMATIIPGVNAPKLIAQTSIYGIDWDAGYVGGVKLRLRTQSSIIVPPDETYKVYVYWIYSETDKWGPYDFTTLEGKGLILPSQGTYKLECKFFCVGGWSSGFEAKYQIIFRGEVLATTATSEDPVTATVTVSGKKGEGVQFLAWLINGGANDAEPVPTVDVTVTKL